MVVLGISMSHDGTISVLKDGNHVYSLAEERVNRRKSYIGFPFDALTYAINSKVFDVSEVGAVAIAGDQFLRRHHWINCFILTKEKIYFDFINDEAPKEFSLLDYNGKPKTDKAAREYVESKIRQILSSYGIDAPIYYVDHHLCHAAAAFYGSGFDMALAVTMDGEGDGLSASISLCENGEIKRIHSTPVSGSAGYLYSEVTRMCGFRANRHEGKITGLAAYGDVKKYEEKFDEITYVDDGRLHYKKFSHPTFFGRLQALMMKAFGNKFFKFFGISNPHSVRELLNSCGEMSREDLSAGIQNHLEKRIVQIVDYWAKSTGKSKIVFSGGVFANVKFNQKISESLTSSYIFIFPDMGDGGNAYGAAEVINRRVGKFYKEPEKMSHVYLGPKFSESIVEECLNEWSGSIDFFRSKCVERDAAQLLAEGRVIGWFQGAMEYGPRALGNRSILASATDADINRWLNQRMKRNEFMPFAPSCLYELADDVFEIPSDHHKYPAEFMTITFRMKPQWIDVAPAVAHIDGTARPQLVSQDANPKFHALLSEYYALTGIPFVVNTSFNVHEEPIVCRPEEGLKALLDGVIDVFVCGDYVVTRSMMEKKEY